MRTTSLLWLSVVAACSSSAVSPVPARPVSKPHPAPLSSTAILTGSRIVATADGALVIDEDSGSLVDLAGRTLRIGRGAGQLVYDPDGGRVYVADRSADHVAVVDVRRFEVIDRWDTPAEPFGIALSPDRGSLLVTTIADRTLAALDTHTGRERWRASISQGARGVSVSPDGTRALVGNTATGDIDLVELDGEHRVATIPFDLSCEHCAMAGAYARGTGTVLFQDATHAIATFQRSTPSILINTTTDLYGGGTAPPVTQHVAFFTLSAASASETVAQVAANQPRPLAWDGTRDLLFIAGHGSDTLLELPGTGTSEATTTEGNASDVVLRAGRRCGPDGMAVAPDGSLFVWCSFTRSVLRIANIDPADIARAELTETPPLVASAWTDTQLRGRVLFDSTTRKINLDGALACTVCHSDGLADGLSWKIGTQDLQTPILAGRLVGTAPFRWDGSAPTLEASLASTVHRLGGSGMSADETAAIIAYIQSLPRPRPPTRDAAAIARGRHVFEVDANCISCHDGPTYSDGETHQFAASTLSNANTPSLIGLASSAPYYHDGSAATLDDLLAGRGAVHGMADMSALTATQRADLNAFLQSL